MGEQRNEIDVYSQEYMWRLMAFKSWYREVMDQATITLANSEYDYSLLNVKYILCNIVENTWKRVFLRLVAPSGFLHKVEDDYRVSAKIDMGSLFTEEEAIRDSIIPAIHSRLQETVNNDQRTMGRRVSLEWTWKQEEESLDINVHVTDDVSPIRATAGASINSEGEHMHALVTQELVQALNETVLRGTAQAFYRSREPRDRRTAKADSMAACCSKQRSRSSRRRESQEQTAVTCTRTWTISGTMTLYRTLYGG